MGAFIRNNLLVRELAVGLLLIIVLVSFYIRYAKASHRRYERTRERRMAMVVRSARRQLVVVLLLLVAVLVYDRVLPHWGLGASQAATQSVKVASSSHQPAAKKAVQSKAASQQAKSRLTQAASAKAASAKQASAQAAASASAKQASAQAAAKSQASQTAASQASAKAASQAQANQPSPKAKAVAAVQQYLVQHPAAAADRVDNVGVIEYSTDYNGIPAYHVGLYQTQGDGSSVAIHMYFVYANGQTAKAY
ncbi:hypothetical protein ACFQ5J_00290 [Lacticaseibacillus baoqingensis]|uniref:PepSY domain-containing protein n=1 Tax=Lacticaseibacillus baoqingensis TaxID=2486013 RepID=A0ABW4E2S1_9LACO|nr:hypothetical protein [Lacticaseibacillus baoqingensis]